MNEKPMSKVALVTGGARGIGRSTSIALAQRGIRVFVNYATNEDAASETVKMCKEHGGIAETLRFNVQESSSVDSAIDSIKEKAGRLDILVNNAGVSHDALFIRMKDEDWERILAINLSGAFYCARAAAKIMMKNRWGRIINISSVVGETGNVDQAAYVASKAGLIGLTKALARELASRNITVNGVTPGFIETDMTQTLDEKVREEILKSIPLARYGKAEEVANLIAYLGSEETAYITGQIIGINGGMNM